MKNRNYTTDATNTPRKDAADRNTSDESLVAAISRDYFEALERGESLNRETLLDQHPEIADELNACIDGLEFLHQAGLRIVDQSSSGEAWGIPGSAEQVALGDFRILREIGRGGMGVVYEATQLSLGRKVALKVLPFAAVLNERQIQRFTNEAQAAALIEHPHIVPVYSIGVERGVHYYAMKLIPGQTLADVIPELDTNPRKGKENGWLGSSAASSQTERPRPGDSLRSTSAIDEVQQDSDEPKALAESSRFSTSDATDTDEIAHLSTTRNANRGEFFRTVARLGIEAAEALHCAHEHGVVHRDIKPSNLLIDRQGKLWIADFGLAQIQAEQNLTMSGDMLGTLRYMSPEQVAGGKPLDQRTDIYSLGVTLYELLLGRPAFTGNDRQQIIRHILEEIPDSAASIDRSVPRDLDTILCKATAKEPSDRYATAAELAADLRLFCEDRPVTARRPSRVERVRRWARRNPAVATLLATILMLLTLLSAGSSVVAWRRTQDALAREFMLYARDMRLVKAAIENGDYFGAEETLSRWDGHDLRGFEWKYLWRQCHTGVAHNQLLGQQVNGLAYSQDGSRLAISHLMTSGIHIHDASTSDGERIEGLKSPSPSVAPLFRQPGTNWLVAGDNGGHVSVWDFQTLEPLFDEPLKVPVDADESDVYSIAISDGGHRFVAVGLGPMAAHGSKSPSEVWVRDRIEERWILVDRFIGRVHVAFVATDRGDLLITGGYENAIRIWDSATWESLGKVDLPAGGWITAMKSSPDGSLLAAASAGTYGSRFKSRIDIWNTKSWSPLHYVSRHEDEVHDLCFSHDGKLISAGGYDGAISLCDTSTGVVEYFASAHQQKIYALTFTPDDKYLCTGAGREVRVWRVEDLLSPQQSDVVLSHHDGRVSDSVFLDQASTVGTVGSTGKVDVWDVKTGKKRHEFQVEHEKAVMSSNDRISRQALAGSQAIPLAFPRGEQASAGNVPHDSVTDERHSIIDRGVFHSAAC